MTANHVFSIANLVAMVAWVLLVLFPRQRAVRLVTNAIVPGLFAAAYALVIAMNWGGSSGGFSSLPAVAALFSNPWLFLAGWIHYLAFDLLIGNWEASDAQARGIPHLLVVPSLVLTFLFGPAGWLLYLATRAARPAKP